MQGSRALQRSDAYAAYCLDEACFLWGSYIEGELEDAKERARGKGKHQPKPEVIQRKVVARLRELLKDEEKQTESESAPVSRAQFKDPAAHFSKK